ncbi:hypothetical protein DXX93_08480 [Thalassotalea euphylliae]|uniref:Uncharacterized protein n=1 Tax=Thalassotalea euphylliae TaxID=1655234 RepID=A0A3E0TQ34_9GAMM|nr:hypothetical protein DXX93_08480 [Thalassotalea euphylliae]
MENTMQKYIEFLIYINFNEWWPFLLGFFACFVIFLINKISASSEFKSNSSDSRNDANHKSYLESDYYHKTVGRSAEVYGHIYGYRPKRDE